MEGAALCSHWNRYIGYGLLVSVHNASAKTNIPGFMEYPMHCHSISHMILTNEVWHCGPSHEIHWPYHPPHGPEGADFTD